VLAEQFNRPLYALYGAPGPMTIIERTLWIAYYEIVKKERETK
jgi:hypothetical protein